MPEYEVLDESPVFRETAAHRWKAPRVQRIPELFAGLRVKRPSTLVNDGGTALMPSGNPCERSRWPTVPSKHVWVCASASHGVSARFQWSIRHGGRDPWAARSDGPIGGSCTHFLRPGRERMVREAESLVDDPTTVGIVPRHRRFSDRRRADLRDRRCSSGSSRGKALSCERRPADARAGGDGGRKSSIPWLEDTRLTASGARPSSFGHACERRLRRGDPARGEAKRGRHLDATVDLAEGAPTPSGACSQPGASRVRRVGRSVGDRTRRGRARELFWLQRSTGNARPNALPGGAREV